MKSINVPLSPPSPEEVLTRKIKDCNKILAARRVSRISILVSGIDQQSKSLSELIVCDHNTMPLEIVELARDLVQKMMDHFVTELSWSDHGNAVDQIQNDRP